MCHFHSGLKTSSFVALIFGDLSLVAASWCFLCCDLMCPSILFNLRERARERKKNLPLFLNRLGTFWAENFSFILFSFLCKLQLLVLEKKWWTTLTLGSEHLFVFLCL